MVYIIESTIEEPEYFFVYGPYTNLDHARNHLVKREEMYDNDWWNEMIETGRGHGIIQYMDRPQAEAYIREHGQIEDMILLG